MDNWYYVDSSGKQVGPVSAAEVRAAVQRGAATIASLAWREGLAGWQPIAELAAELGLPGSGTATVATPAPGVPPPPVAAAETNPYRAPDSESGEGYFDSADVVYAGFWRRWAALYGISTSGDISRGIWERSKAGREAIERWSAANSRDDE